MSGKLIITKADWINSNKPDCIFSGLYSEEGFYQIGFTQDSTQNQTSGQVGDIIVGRVRDIVKNINAAFIEIGQGVTGYYSLEENVMHHFLNSKNTDKLCQGDLILIQIKKAAVKTKAPVLTSKISLSGQYAVLNIYDKGIGFSNKISDRNRCAQISKSIKNQNEFYDCGIIVRTNAVLAEDNEILDELRDLRCQWDEIYNEALHRPCYSVIRYAEPEYLRLIKGSYSGEIDEIITDNYDIHQKVVQYVHNLSLGIKLTYYQDDLLPLYKLYSLESVSKNVLSKTVWLKSGAYLVIEPTEAMVVIDVNTGKCMKGKKQEETICKVNIEAAKEIASQIRLRNLSGIIIIDFINMNSPENQEQLIEELKQYIARDKIKTTFVEMTKLNLVLLTRKKTDAPVYEQLERMR